MPSILSLVLLLALSALTLVPERAQARQPGARRVPFEEVLDLASPVLGLERRDLVPRTREEWCAFWQEVHGAGPPCDTGLVDFRRQVVLASIGARAGNGCADTEVVEVRGVSLRRRGRVLLVDVQDVVPVGCICSRAFQTPVHAVVVRRPVRSAYFRHEEAVLNCESR